MIQTPAQDVPGESFEVPVQEFQAPSASVGLNGVPWFWT